MNMNGTLDSTLFLAQVFIVLHHELKQTFPLAIKESLLNLKTIKFTYELESCQMVSNKNFYAFSLRSGSTFPLQVSLLFRCTCCAINNSYHFAHSVIQFVKFSFFLSSHKSSLSKVKKFRSTLERDAFNLKEPRWRMKVRRLIENAVLRARMFIKIKKLFILQILLQNVCQVFVCSPHSHG